MNQGSIQDTGDSGLAVEGQLPSLTDRLKSLYVAIGQNPKGENGGPSLQARKERAQRLLRRSVTGEILQDNAYVAVAGLQGAGKSTFVNYLLRLADTDILLEGAGIGEELAIFITFTDAGSQPRRYVQALNDEAGGEFIVKKDIADDLWESILRNEDSNVLAVHLELPKDTIHTSLVQVMGGRRGIALLPGYTKFDPKSDEAYAQELMRETLAQSAGVIVVTSQSDLANVASREIMSDLRADLPGIIPSVIVPSTSRAQADEPENRELRLRIEELFDLAQSREDQGVDRVIFYDAVDDSSEDYEAVMKDVCSVLAASSHSTARINVRSQERVRARSTKRLIDDVTDFLLDMDKVSQEMVLTGDVNSTNARVLLDELLEETRKLRKDYEQRVDQALKTRSATATKAALLKHTELNEWDIKKLSTYKTGFDKIFETAAESESKYQIIVSESWIDAITSVETDKDSFAVEHAQIVADAVEERLRRNGDFVYSNIWPKGEAALGLAKQITAVEIQQRNTELAYLLGAEDREYSYTNETLPAVRFLPSYLLVFDQLSAGNALPGSPISVGSVLEFGGDGDKFIERLQNLDQQQRLMIQTIGRIFFLEAGEITLEALIGNVASGVTGVTVLPAAAATAVTMAAAGVGLVTLIIAVQAHTKRVDARNRNQLRGVMNSISANLKAALIQHFDNITDAMYEQVESALRKQLHLEAPIIAQLNLEKAISDTRAVTESMRAGVSNRAILGD